MSNIYGSITSYMDIVYTLVSAPSAPILISAIPQSTTISITWTQPPGEGVDSYTISYTTATSD